MMQGEIGSRWSSKQNTEGQKRKGTLGRGTKGLRGDVAEMVRVTGRGFLKVAMGPHGSGGGGGAKGRQTWFSRPGSWSAHTSTPCELPHSLERSLGVHG